MTHTSTAVGPNSQATFLVWTLRQPGLKPEGFLVQKCALQVVAMQHCSNVLACNILTPLTWQGSLHAAPALLVQG